MLLVLGQQLENVCSRLNSSKQSTELCQGLEPRPPAAVLAGPCMGSCGSCQWLSCLEWLQNMEHQGWRWTEAWNEERLAPGVY